MTSRLAILAFCLGEWSSALSHLEAIQRADIWIDGGTRDRLEDEVSALSVQWLNERYPDAPRVSMRSLTPIEKSYALIDARAWATENQPEIDALAQQEGAPHDPADTTGTGAGP